MNHLSVSVIIPTYNRQALTLRAVRSVLAQSYRDFELIVIDDGSIDDLSPVCDLVRSNGHQFFRTENRGVAAARNKALSLTHGNWVALLDSDDHWLPEKLETQVRFHQKNPACQVSQCEEDWYRSGKRVTREQRHAPAAGDAFARSCQLCCVSSSSVMLRRTIFTECGGYDERLPACEDYDLWLRVTSRYEVGLVPEKLVEKYGGHSDQLSKRYPVMDRFRVFSLLKLVVSSELSSDQQKLALTELRKKVEILAQGATKRGQPISTYYEALIRAVDSCLSFDVNPSFVLIPFLEAGVDLIGHSYPNQPHNIYSLGQFP